MYSRQKILLSLLDILGGELNSIDMMKYLFLLSEKQKIPSYIFIPYKFGCFSFQAYDDKRKLIKEGYLEDISKFKVCKSNIGIYNELSPEDQKSIKEIENNFRNITGNALLRRIYIKYPYYAIKSKISQNLLKKEEIDKIDAIRPRNEEKVLYSIGYEGKRLEEYINILIKQDVKLVCDVRKNPISRKYGFSKSTLKRALETVDISYLHFPELGISSSKRHYLNSLNDYDILFEDYKKTVLDKQKDLIQTIYLLLKENHRIALTCFEKEPEKCHRTVLAERIIRQTDNEFFFREC